MPRLLSNKSPNKKSSVKVEEYKPIISQVKVKAKSPGTKSVDEMSSWEYYNSLMLFGKRRMDRFEWRIWVEKKNKEDFHKKYIMNDEGRYVKRICSREFNWRLKRDPDFDERLCMIDDKLK